MAHSFNTNLNNVVKHYIEMLKVPVTKTTISEKLTHNPYYPSLYSITNVFDKLNISNEAYQLVEEDLNKIEPPFITYCSDQNTGNDFVLVTKITETSVSYISESSKPRQLPRDLFVKQWQKTVFMAEGNVQSGEQDFAAKQKKERSQTTKQTLLYAGIILLVCLTVYMFIGNAGLSNIIATIGITFIKLLGVVITTLLLVYEIDKTNSVVKNICTAGKQINCDAVLNSKAAKILGMSWGEVGFFYFATTTFFLIFPGLLFINKLPWLAIASTLASPYILFSIYYQWSVVKQWCPLCLVVQAVLAMELIWAITYFWDTKFQYPIANVNILLPIGCSILVIFIVWYLLKPLLLSAKVATEYNAAYKRFLYNPEIFNSLLQQQSAMPEGWQSLGINMGNPNATSTIVKVCSPYCNPCAIAHSVLEGIIKRNTDVNLKIIFFVGNAEINTANKPVKHLLAIASKGNLTLTKEALDAWYLSRKKDYQAFSLKFPLNGELRLQDEKIDKMMNWCLAADIIGTPTIFINGKKLPQTYNIDELQYLI